MSEAEATEALLARLSYQASMRAGEMAKRAASRLSIFAVAKLALIFCLLVSQFFPGLAIFENIRSDFSGFSLITPTKWHSPKQKLVSLMFCLPHLVYSY